MLHVDFRCRTSQTRQIRWLDQRPTMVEGDGTSCGKTHSWMEDQEYCLQGEETNSIGQRRIVWITASDGLEWQI